MEFDGTVSLQTILSRFLAVASLLLGVQTSPALAGTISGTITDEADGSPVGDIWVGAHRIDEPGSFSAIRNDAQGNYTLDLPEEGDYVVTTLNANKPWDAGYIDELYPDVRCFKGCDLSDAEVISVTDNSVTTGIDIALTKGGSISGTVLSEETGMPLTIWWEHFSVEVFDSSGQKIPNRWSHPDSTGRYILRGLIGGSYFVKTSTDHIWPFVDELFDDIECMSACDVTTGDVVYVVLGEETGDIDFDIQHGLDFRDGFESNSLSRWSYYFPRP